MILPEEIKLYMKQDPKIVQIFSNILYYTSMGAKSILLAGLYLNYIPILKQLGYKIIDNTLDLRDFHDKP